MACPIPAEAWCVSIPIDGFENQGLEKIQSKDSSVYHYSPKAHVKPLQSLSLYYPNR